MRRPGPPEDACTTARHGPPKVSVPVVNSTSDTVRTPPTRQGHAHRTVTVPQPHPCKFRKPKVHPNTAYVHGWNAPALAVSSTSTHLAQQSRIKISSTSSVSLSQSSDQPTLELPRLSTLSDAEVQRRSTEPPALALTWHRNVLAFFSFFALRLPLGGIHVDKVSTYHVRSMHQSPRKKRKRKPNRQQLLGTPAVHSPLTFLSGWRVQAAEKCASWVVRALSKCVGPLHGSSPRHESRTPGGIRDKSEPYIRSTSYTYILLRFV